jgi:hypothetical protein
MPAMVRAQSNPALPSAPSSIASTATTSTGSISGTVVDSDGDAIVGAELTLAGDPLAVERKLVADAKGYFSFTDLPTGDFRLITTSPGFAALLLPLHLATAQQMQTADIVLKVANADSSIDVTMTVHEIAEEQIRTEEKQRLVGALPNWYVTYDWHAAPMSAGQKFKMSTKLLFDPSTFVLAGIIAGVEQATNAFPGYHQGAAGFGKRLGATLADTAVGSLLGGAVFPAIFRQDPRYFYKGTGTITSRALYALAAAFICRGDNGKWQPNYSSIAADVTTGFVSNTYYPASDQVGATRTLEIGLINAGEEGFSNLLQEFVFKHFTRGTPKTGAGKQPTPKP